MHKIGILPLAGNANRFNGVVKELLPIDNNKCVVDCSINAMINAGVTDFVVVTNQGKLPIHYRHFNRLNSYDGLSFAYINQNYRQDLLGAIITALNIDADMYYVALPDTVFPEDCFISHSIENDINLNWFNTTKPERFGVLFNRTDYNEYYLNIVDKPTSLPYDTYSAWGSFSFNRAIASMIRRSSADTLHGVLNSIKYNSIYYNYMKYYYDMANFSEYVNYLKGGYENTDINKTLFVF